MDSRFSAIWILVVVTQLHVTSANPIDFDEGSAEESDAPVHFITVEEIPVEHTKNGTEMLMSIKELLGINKLRPVGHTDSHGENEIQKSVRTRRKIIGDDDRLPVPTNYVNRSPYCAIGRLDSGCTAVMIGPHHALTAGHCVYDIDRNVWKTNVDIWRGRTCNAVGARMEMSTVWSLLGYTRDHRKEYDLALIAFNRSRTSPSPCWLSFGPTPSVWPGVGFRLYGYPQDYASRRGCSYHTMTHSSCSFSRTSYGGLATEYKCDTVGGISGAGLYGDIGRTYGPVVYGVNAYQYTSSPWNWGPLFTASRFCTFVRLMNSTGYHPACGGRPCCTQSDLNWFDNSTS